MHTVKWLNSSFWPIDETLTGTKTSGLVRPWSNDNKRILHIFQISRTGVSSSNIFVSDSKYTLEGRSYLSAATQSAFSTAPFNWAMHNLFFFWSLFFNYLFIWLIFHDKTKKKKRIIPFLSLPFQYPRLRIRYKKGAIFFHLIKKIFIALGEYKTRRFIHSTNM